jgi:hypothetical protein
MGNLCIHQKRTIDGGDVRISWKYDVNFRVYR